MANNINSYMYQEKFTHKKFNWIKLDLVVGDTNFNSEGFARKNPVDDPDAELVLLLAYGRALEVLAHKVMREAEKRMRHQDYVAAQKAARGTEVSDIEEEEVQDEEVEKVDPLQLAIKVIENFSNGLAQILEGNTRDH